MKIVKSIIGWLFPRWKTIETVPFYQTYTYKGREGTEAERVDFLEIQEGVNGKKRAYIKDFRGRRNKADLEFAEEILAREPILYKTCINCKKEKPTHHTNPDKKFMCGPCYIFYGYFAMHGCNPPDTELTVEVKEYMGKYSRYFDGGKTRCDATKADGDRCTRNVTYRSSKKGQLLCGQHAKLLDAKVIA